MSDRDGEDAIYVINPDGSNLKRITVGHGPDWAPGGRHLAFGRRDGGIYIINVDTLRETRVTSGSSPAWSPDGQRLVYARNGIETINADGTQPRRIVNAAIWNTSEAEYGAGWPSWSPDGQTIAFIRTSWDDGWYLFVVDADGATPPRMLAQGAAENTAWSPDGSRIAYAASRSILGRPPTPSPCCVVQTVLSSGGFPTPVADGFWPDWTPTGDLIFEAFAVNGSPAPYCCGNKLRIFASGSDTSIVPEAVAPRRADYSDKQPVWSR